MKLDLRDIGERVADHQNQALERHAVAERVRARVVATAREERRWHRIGWLMAFGASAMALTAILFWVKHPPQMRGDALSFQIGHAPRTGVSGEWVKAPPTESLPLHFNDGSVLQAQPHAQLRVTTHAPAQVEVVLEQGEVDASVAHQSHGAWILRAGPFAVRVVGTRFRLAWAPQAQRFSLRLDEGEVKVSGGPAGHGRTVTAGQTLAFTLPNPSTRGAPGEPTAGDTALQPLVPLPSAPQPNLAKQPATPRWKALAVNGRYKEALAALSASERAQALAHADASDLTTLANVARYAGHNEEARRFLLAVRRRFATDARAAEAAFLLGRIAFENQRHYSEAARWWQLYASEQPNGALAREAGGRRIEALAHGGNLDEAKHAARAYLDSYPTGPHAPYAKALLAR